MPTYTIPTPGILDYVEIPLSNGKTAWYKPLHAGPPYNTVVTVLVDSENITVTDDHGTAFVKVNDKKEKPRSVKPRLSVGSVRTYYWE